MISVCTGLKFYGLLKSKFPCGSVSKELIFPCGSVSKKLILPCRSVSKELIFPCGSVSKELIFPCGSESKVKYFGSLVKCKTPDLKSLSSSLTGSTGLLGKVLLQVSSVA